ncbi:BT4734/BF3469 family protein [Dysgonomonas sp. Marseille-P4361]|uniref:BT4734/BF3469 family protein n=1 Tax=Dysgonomonas sp. Marseille-P4361 TaxID=2161820 RepID=UPI000D555440|nr:BT4734/BF3469 family protein [Dysgonomonas sp. Marseille-P4361]
MYKNIEISYFSNHSRRFPEGNINLWWWLYSDKNYLPLITKIRQCKDKEEQRKLKASLPCATISGIFYNRNSDGLMQHSGLICIDIDGADNPHVTNMEDLKIKLSELPYILYCGLSVSGKGLMCIIPIEEPKCHRKHFFALEKEFKELEISVDAACKDVTRLRYKSYDEKPYFNHKATSYTDKLDRTDIKESPRRKTDKDNTAISYSVADIRISRKQTDFMDEMSYIGQPLPDYSNYPIICEKPDDYKKQLLFPYIMKVVASEVDITYKRSDWIQICGIIARYFGENGRILFHQISQFYRKGKYFYTQQECNDLYDGMLNNKYNYNTDRFFEILDKYNIKL